MARRSGALTGSERSITLLTSEKIAVVAPMPRASESAAMTEATGVARNVRKAKRRSRMPILRKRELLAVRPLCFHTIADSLSIDLTSQKGDDPRRVAGDCLRQAKVEDF